MAKVPRLLIALALGALVTACPSDSDGESAGPTTTKAPRPGAVESMAVNVADDRRSAPTKMRAGALRLDVTNNGTADHELTLVRLEDGKSLPDVQDHLADTSALPDWAPAIGGLSRMSARTSANVSDNFGPGDYALVCLLPGPNLAPFATTGVASPLELTGEPEGLVERPGPALVIDEFITSPTITDRAYRLTVRNETAVARWLNVARLDANKTTEDLVRWLAKPEGQSPGVLLGGPGPIAPKADAVFELLLTPGKYVYFAGVRRDGAEIVAPEHTLPFEVKVT